VAALSGGNQLKGLVAGGIGLVLAMVGLDPQEGIERYTFGQVALWEGLGLVPIVVGLFAIPEIIELWMKGTSIAETRIGKLGGVWQGIKDTFIHLGITFRCSMIGTFIGIIPGLGGSVAQWVSYAHAVQSSPDQSRFGQGDVRGVLGPGAANNSGAGGALIPTIAFGVPGNLVMAILLGAFIIQGVQPGPDMLTTNLPLTFSMVWVIVVANIVTVAICLLFLNQLAKITYLRAALLIPILITLVYLGGYVDANSFLAMGLALLFGLIGMLMVYLDWPRPPLVLGLVLGPLVERYVFISYRLYEFGFLLRPLVVVILLIAAAVLFLPSLQRSGGKWWRVWRAG
jgi:putative tricarboxylic transport membrane protein